VRTLVLGLIGTAFTLVATGQAHGYHGFIAALLLVPLSTAVLLLFYTAIGLLSVWMFDAMPVYWVFSKAMYVLGGLMIPISIYPDWLQRVAACTPFYALLYGVSRQTISFSADIFILSATMLAGWAVLAVVLICRIYSRVNRTICLGGG
jgi:ABC-2 type transport system permease protein